MSESFAELVAESLSKTQMRPGAILTGMVVSISSDYVVVNAGLKSEGMIPIEQFRDENDEIDIGIGDEVDVALEMFENGQGVTLLSREKAKRAASWTRLEKAHEIDETVTGRIMDKVKGGLTVKLADISAFLPGSLLDVRPVRDTDSFVGKDFEFKVIKLDQKRNNVVVSRRAVIEAESSEERAEVLEKLQEGQQISGVVKNLTDYGAFVDLGGGIDGLLHITDMAWKRIKHPNEVVNVDDEIDVKILKFDRSRNRISLGLKQLGTDPWDEINRRYPANTRMFGKVTNLADYGCFVEIEEGVEGLVHVSEMDWTNKNIHPSKVVQLGDEVEVMVIEIDTERRRISLGMKQCVPNPWEQFATNHTKGDKVSGNIKSITDFGIFIGLSGGIDGLVHLSDISWNTPGDEAVRNYRKGEDVEAIILAIDPERERISLGIKQLVQDPFASFLSAHQKGSVIPGVVKSVDAKGAIIALDEHVVGYLHASELASARVEDARTVLSEGDEIEAKFIGIDRKNRSVKLSIKAKDIAEEKEAIKDYKRTTTAPVTPTLGDLIKEQMENQNN